MAGIEQDISLQWKLVTEKEVSALMLWKTTALSRGKFLKWVITDRERVSTRSVEVVQRDLEDD